MPETERVEATLKEIGLALNLESSKFQSLVGKAKLIADAKGEDMEAPVDAPAGEGAAEEAGDAGDADDAEEGKEEDGANDG